MEPRTLADSQIVLLLVDARQSSEATVQRASEFVFIREASRSPDQRKTRVHFEGRKPFPVDYRTSLLRLERVIIVLEHWGLIKCSQVHRLGRGDRVALPVFFSREVGGICRHRLAANQLDIDAAFTHHLPQFLGLDLKAVFVPLGGRIQDCSNERDFGCQIDPVKCPYASRPIEVNYPSTANCK